MCLHGLYLHNVLLQTLLDDVKGDTHGEFEDILVALITPPAAYDCHEVMRAMEVSPKPALCHNFTFKSLKMKASLFVILQGVGTKDSILIEIFASRTNEQIRALNEAYLKGILLKSLFKMVKSAKHYKCINSLS